MRTIPAILDDLEVAEQETLVRSLPDYQVAAIEQAFPEWAHSGQLAPPRADWRTWVIMAGRGFGKTRAGAEWVLECVRGGGGAANMVPSPAGRGRGGGSTPALTRGLAATLPHPQPLPAGEGRSDLRIALVAASIEEARAVMVEGASGILSCAREGEIAEWTPSLHELRFAGGAVATLYSGASPEKLRGPQHHFAWCDELAKWRHPQRTWDMLQLGLRCGAAPRALVTTTPRGGCGALAGILADPATAVTGGPSQANPHLPRAFLAAIEAAYGGTRMGREEVGGEFLSDVAGSLWPRALIEGARGAVPPRAELARVIVGVDPPASAEGTCGIVVCGLDAGGTAHVLADCSAGGLSPEGWARAVAGAAEAWEADRVVAEANQGGDMVRAVLASVGERAALSLVSATRGKAARAEPVAGLFESGRARLAGAFPALEDQLAGLVAGGSYAGPGKSPDRADAMVWALTALCLKRRAEPRVWQV